MVAQSCKVVIACRARKDQKAKLTRLVRNGNREVVTLAIGDGANDVEMIRTAHIGVGVIGKEGTQAVNNADYAIGQFRFLTRLLLVYGHRNYRGITLAALLIFYKNILFTLVQYLYTFLCGMSGTRNQSYIAIFWYNTALTAFGPLLLAIFDRDISDANLFRFPELHREGIDHRLFSVRRFLVYLVKAIWESLAIFCVMIFAFERTDFAAGTIDVWLFGMVSVTINIFLANLSSSIEQSILFWLSVIAFWGTFVFWMILVAGTSFSVALSPSFFHSFEQVFCSPTVFFIMALAVTLAILPTMVVKALSREVAPTLGQFIQDVQVRSADASVVKSNLKEMERNRSLDLELRTLRGIPEETSMPELMEISEEVLASRPNRPAMNVAPVAFGLTRTGNTQRSIRSMAGLRALEICNQLHGPSYDSQSVNDEAQNYLIRQINSHKWRTVKPDLMGSLKAQLLEATPKFIQRVSDSLKETQFLHKGNKKGELSVVKEEEEEIENPDEIVAIEEEEEAEVLLDESVRSSYSVCFSVNQTTQKN